MLSFLDRLMNWVLGGSTLLAECDVNFERSPTSKRTALLLQKLISIA